MATSAPEIEGDFDFYLRFVKPLVLNLNEPNERALAAAWVQKLRDENSGSSELRADYLKLLLFVLQRKQLIGVFSENPNQYETLEKFPETNLHDVARELLEAEEDSRRRQQDVGGAAGDFPPYSTEHSADLLEYSAAQDIPNFGVHAYYAVSKEPLPKWERTEKAVFPRGVASTTERKIRTDILSRTSSATSEPTLDGDTGSRDRLIRKGKSRKKHKTKKDKTITSDEEDKAEGQAEEKGHSRHLEERRTPPRRKSLGHDESPSPPMGSVKKDQTKESRESPTWGSNLIGVSEPPIRETPPEADVSEKESESSISSDYPSLPYRTPSPRRSDEEEPFQPSTPPYSPLFPEGEADPFFLGTPPSFLGGTSLTEVSPVKMPSPSQKARIYSDLDALDRMISKYESDDYVSPARSTQRAPVPDVETQPTKKVVKTKKGAKKTTKPPTTRPGSAKPGQKGSCSKTCPSDSSRTSVASSKRTPAAGLPKSSRVPGTGASRTSLPKGTRVPTGASKTSLPEISKKPSQSTSRLQAPGTSRIQAPGTSRIQAPGTSRLQAPGTSRIQAPGTSRIQAPGTSRLQAPGTSRIQAPGTSRIQAPGTSRIQAPGTSRIQAPGTSRLQAPGTSRLQALGTSGIPAPGGSRIAVPGGSRMPRPVSRIPSAGRTGIPKPGAVKALTAVPVSEVSRPYSPIFPEGSEEPFFLESPPSFFLDDSTLPSLQSYEEYPSLPIRTPSPKRPTPTRSVEMADLSAASLPYHTPSPRRPYEEVDMANLSAPSLPYRTPSPRMPCPGATAQATYNLDELNELGLRPEDLDDAVFDLEEVYDMKISDISSSSNIEYEDNPEFNINDAEIDRELDEWDKMIAELEAEHAEDIALYSTPPKKSKKSRVTTLSVQPAKGADRSVPVMEEDRMIDMADLSAASLPYRTPPPRPGEEVNMADLSAASLPYRTPSPRRPPPCPGRPAVSRSRIPPPGASRIPGRGASGIPAPGGSRIPARGASGIPAPGGSRIPARGVSRIPAAGSSRIPAAGTSRIPPPGASRIASAGRIQAPPPRAPYSPQLTSDWEEPFFLESPPSFFLDDSTLPSLKSYEEYPSLPIRTPSPRRPTPSRSIDMADLSAPSLPYRSPCPASPVGPRPGSPATATGHLGYDLDELKELGLDPADLNDDLFNIEDIDNMELSDVSIGPVEYEYATEFDIDDAEINKDLDEFDRMIAELEAEHAEDIALYGSPPQTSKQSKVTTLSVSPARVADRSLMGTLVAEAGDASGGEGEVAGLAYSPTRRDMADLSEPSLPYRTPSPRRPYPGEDIDMADLSAASLPYRTPSPRRPVPSRPAMTRSRIQPPGGSRIPARGASGIPASGGSRIPARGASGIPAPGGSRIPARGASGIPAPGGSRIPARGASGIPAPGGSRIPARGASGIPAPGGSRIPARGASGIPAPGGSRIPARGDSRPERTQVAAPPTIFSPIFPEGEEDPFFLEGPPSPKRPKSPGVTFPDSTPLRVAQGSPAAQDIVDAFNEQLESPEFLTAEDAERHYQELKRARLEAEYQKRYEHRRPDMPRTPPMFSRFGSVMGDEDIEYDPSEFGETGGADWAPAEQFFEDKKSLSPRPIGPRGSIVKPYFSGIEREPEGEQFFADESQPELVDFEDEFETSPASERSPAATQEEVEKKVHETEKQLALKKETTPAEGGLPVTTPRSSPFPIRPNKSIRVETEEGDASFEMPSFEGPDYKDKLYFESPPNEYYGSPGSPMSPDDRDALPAPHDLPKRALLSPIKVPDLTEFYAKQQLMKIKAKAEQQLRELDFSPPRAVRPTAQAIAQQVRSQTTPSRSPITQQQQQTTSRRSPSPQQGDRDILDTSISEDIPSPIQPPTLVPGWATPPRLKTPRAPRRPQLLPGPAENLTVKPELRDILGQEMPPSEMVYSPPPLSPSDVRPSPIRIPSPRASSPCAAAPCTPSPRTPPRRTVSPRAVSPSVAPPGGPLFQFSLEDDDDLFGTDEPPEMFESPLTGIRTPPRPTRAPESPISPAESPLTLRTRLLEADEPPYYSKDGMYICQGRIKCRKQFIQRKSPAPNLHRLHEVPDDYPEENAPFLSQVEAAKPGRIKDRRRILASPGMETVHESPIQVPALTVEDQFFAATRPVRELVDYYGDLTQDITPPDDMFGAVGPIDWSTSPTEFDRPITENLPPPLRPPTLVPGWTTPPRLITPRIPRRAPPLLPGAAENIRVRPGARDILGQEMPPAEMIFSPPHLSPGEYPPPRPVRTQSSPPAHSPRAASQRTPSPRAGALVRSSPALFDAGGADDIFGDDIFGTEAPPEEMFQSPRTPIRTPTPPRRPGRSPESPLSSPESPFALKIRLLEAGEPDYYSREEMEIPQGRVRCRRQVLHRKSPAPSLHRLREVVDDYQEENVPFLSQVEAAKRGRKKARKKIVAAPGMDTVLESPMQVPAVTDEDRFMAAARAVQSVLDQYGGSPEDYEPPPEDLLGASGPIDWQASPTEFDRPITENLPSPIRPPTLVPGWTTPPRLITPRMPRRPPLLPALTEHVRVRPGARNIIGLEMPPESFIHSPPQLSPGEYPPRRSAAKASPRTQSPGPSTRRTPSPRATSPAHMSPSIFDATPTADIFEDEAPPEEMFQSPTSPIRTPPPPERTPPQPERPPGSPTSPAESPFSLKIRLFQADEPNYYSREEMEIPQGRVRCRRQILHRKSPAPSLHRLHEVADDYQEEDVPFLSQVEAAKPGRKKARKRIVAAPGMDIVHESPMHVPPMTHADHIASLRKIVREIQARYPTPEIQVLPDDLMDAEGSVAWQEDSGMLDTSIPEDLPSPIRPPTIVPGWSTPPTLTKRQPEPPPYEFKFIPALKDVLFQEMPPPEMAFASPPPLAASTPYPTFDLPAPRVSPPTFRTIEELFEQEPQFLAVEIPPDELVEMDSSDNLDNSMRYVVAPFSPEGAIEEPTPVVAVPPAISRSQQLQQIRQNLFSESKQFDESEICFVPPRPRALPQPQQPPQALERIPQLPQAIIDEQYADLYNVSLEDYEALEKAMLAEFPDEVKVVRTPPPKALIDQMIATGGILNKQMAELQRSPTWLESVEQKVINIPEPHIPRRTIYSPEYGALPRYSPKLPKVHRYADQIEEEFVPQGVWGYESPKTPPPSPKAPRPKTPTPKAPSPRTAVEQEYHIPSIFDETEGPSIFESTPPGEYAFSPPSLSPQTSPSTPTPGSPYSPYMGFTPPSPTSTSSSPSLYYSPESASPSAQGSPISPPMSPFDFNLSVMEHDYTPQFFDTSRPAAQNIVRIKNKMIRLQRHQRPPPLEDIEEYEEESMHRESPSPCGRDSPCQSGSPNYELPMPVYYGSPEREYARTPMQQTDGMWGEQYESPERVPFAGQASPEILDTSLIADLDESFVEEDMSGFKWMG